MMILDKRYGETTLYRWLYPDDKPATQWFNTLEEALSWIIQYDSNRLDAS